MPLDTTNDSLFALQRDLEQQQLRVLLLIDAVSEVPGTGGKLDGLTKLAKLDFLCRYADVAPLVERVLRGGAPNLETALRSDSPMTRHKYGPWDDRYYPVIGALVGRGLVTYVQGRHGSVAMKLTSSGKALTRQITEDAQWVDIARSYQAVAAKFGLESGNRLKDAIYAALPTALNVPHRTVLR
jgi:hypothetical protein